VFVSEYVFGSAIDLVRLAGSTNNGLPPTVRTPRCNRRSSICSCAIGSDGNLADAFASPEVYFRQCLAKMAGNRLLGINAIRANPSVIATA